MGAPMYVSAYGNPSDVNLVGQILHWGRILALVIAILGFIAAAAYALFSVFFPPDLTGAVYWAIAGVVNLLVYSRLGQEETLYQTGQYVQVRESLLIWAILALIFGVIVGVLLLIAYVKLEDVTRGMPPTPVGIPPPAASAPATSMPTAAAPFAAPPPPPPQTPAAPICPKCGQPATWVPQYSRWYCYRDSQYL